jgi:hypothetical protein
VLKHELDVIFFPKQKKTKKTMHNINDDDLIKKKELIL